MSVDLNNPVIVAAIITGAATVVGTIIGYLEKIRRDSALTRRQSYAVERSINGRPSTLSDRIDGLATKDDIAVIVEQLTGVKEKNAGQDRRIEALSERLTQHIGTGDC